MPAPIPIIDLADHEEQILPTLERALCDIGFVLVTGHDVPAELVRNLRQHLNDYFDRPLSEKMAERITPDNYRGYIPLGFFSPNTEGIKPDQYEGYKLHAKSRRTTRYAPPVTFMVPIGGQTSPPVCERPPKLFGRPVRPRGNDCLA